MGGKDGCWLRGGTSPAWDDSAVSVNASGACPARAARFLNVARLFWNQELTTLVSLTRRSEHSLQGTRPRPSQ
jgi:hypothetical protein